MSINFYYERDLNDIPRMYINPENGGAGALVDTRSGQIIDLIETNLLTLYRDEIKNWMVDVISNNQIVLDVSKIIELNLINDYLNSMEEI